MSSPARATARPIARTAKTASRRSSGTAGREYGALDDLVGYAMRRAQLRMYEDLLATLAPWTLTPARFSAMTLIAANPGMKSTTLAGMLGVARSGVVAVVNALETLGYVRKLASGVDRRAFALELTPAGRAALQAITAAVREHDLRVTAALSEAERAQLISLLRRVG